MSRWGVFALVFAWMAPAGAQPLQGPAAEVRPGDRLDVPKVPSFDLAVPGDPYRGVHELRVMGKKLLDTEIQVKGYVIWVYDCVTALSRPGMSRAKIQKSIDDDPTQCERKKFYLGDKKTSPPEQGLWVVDVPRPPNKLERERLPKEEIKNWPKVPQYKVGDYVVVTGRFALSSPHAERNSDGLLVFKSLARAKPTKATKTKESPTLAALPPFAVKQPVARPVDATTRGNSIRSSNQGTKHYGMKQYTEAIASYREAVKLWPDNHVAWYGLAGAMIGQANWPAAQEAMQRAFEVAPSEAMYAMVYGYCVYNAALFEAREKEARKHNLPPDQVAPDVGAINFDKARQLLTHAVTLNPDLWRAHYYLGRIHRDGGAAKTAAEEFSKAVSYAPADPSPYVALGELYRQWDYTQEAMTVATAGTTKIPGTKEVSDLWYVVGMAWDDRRKDAKAIEAFTKAIDANPGNAKAYFQRGQVYFRTRQKAKAKADLETFLASPGTSVEFSKQQANKMLMDLAAR